MASFLDNGSIELLSTKSLGKRKGPFKEMILQEAMCLVRFMNIFYSCPKLWKDHVKLLMTSGTQ